MRGMGITIDKNILILKQKNEIHNIIIVTYERYGNNY